MSQENFQDTIKNKDNSSSAKYSQALASTLNTTNDNYKSFIIGSGATEKNKRNEAGMDTVPERDDMNSRSMESGDEKMHIQQNQFENPSEMYQQLDSEPIRQSNSSKHELPSTQSISPERHVKGERGSLIQLNEASEQHDLSGEKMRDFENGENNFAMEMQHIEGQQNQAQDIHEFNRELQWTLIQMKKDNEELTNSLHFLIDGGDKEQVIDLLKQK